MSTAEPKRRWFHLSPDRLVVVLLLGVCLLWLSDRFQWLGFNHHKGCTVLISVAAVGLTALVTLTWWAVSLVFHWRFQFRIQSLLAFCLVCSIAAGWLAVEKDRAQKQRRASEEITKLGNGLWYDWECDADGMPKDIYRNSAPLKPPAPVWLRQVLGVDFFSSVDSVWLYNTPVTDEGLEQLKELPQLRWLNLASTNVTDAGLEHLKGLTQLQTLWLAYTDITDAGIEHLSGLVQLQSLQLAGTKVTDAGLAHLHELTQLQSLDLSKTGITDAGLERLKNLTGLEHRKGLTALARLNLEHTKVTAEGVKRLQQALPNCDIRY